MARISLSLGERKNIFLYSSIVENLFINEFLPDAPGDYVKVYLFGLMYAQYDQALDTGKIAMQLGLREEEVEEAWVYWEAAGLIKRRIVKDINGEEAERIKFISLVDEFYGRSQEEEDLPPVPEAAPRNVDRNSAAAASSDNSGGNFAGSAGNSDADDEAAAENEVSSYLSLDDMDFDDAVSEKLIDRQLQNLYTRYQEAAGRTISRRETGRIADAIRVYYVEPEVFAFAIDYCMDLGKDSIDYIFTVAYRWNEEGCRTVDEVKALLEKHSIRNSWYGQVFKALGWSRLPAPADREIMDRWFDDMECTIGEVLDACAAAAGIREPNLRYVNKVIENRRLEKGGVNTRAAATGSAGSGASAAFAGASGAGANPTRSGSAASKGGSPVSRKVLFDYYEHIRGESEKEQKRRIKEAAENIPGMRKLFEAENAANSKVLSLKPGAASLGRRQELRAERLRIEDARRDLLEANGLPADWLTRHYKCSKCKDTGYTDEGMVCSCAKIRAEEAYKWYTEKESRK